MYYELQPLDLTPNEKRKISKYLSACRIVKYGFRYKLFFIKIILSFFFN